MDGENASTGTLRDLRWKSAKILKSFSVFHRHALELVRDLEQRLPAPDSSSPNPETIVNIPDLNAFIAALRESNETVADLAAALTAMAAATLAPAAAEEHALLAEGLDERAGAVMESVGVIEKSFSQLRPVSHTARLRFEKACDDFYFEMADHAALER